MEESKEELRRRMLREEDEEDRELSECELRLEYMLEDCTEFERCVYELIDEQRELLNRLRMRKSELLL